MEKITIHKNNGSYECYYGVREDREDGEIVEVPEETVEFIQDGVLKDVEELLELLYNGYGID